MEGTSHDPERKRSSDCNKCWVGMQNLKLTCTGKPGWISHPEQFPSLLFLTGMAVFPAWADVLTEWGLLKALLDDKEKL